jgi:methylthioribulose-1-phosphate dehydratase
MPAQNQEDLKKELVETVRFLHGKGWAPATSSNYSFRVPSENIFWISRSGIDKGSFDAEHLMLIDDKADPVTEPGAKSSAETLLHLLLYKDPDIGAVLHTHTVNNTVISLAHEKEKGIAIDGYEVLKGLNNIKSHEEKIWLPIFGNSQDMNILSEDILQYHKEHPDMPAFLLAGHGLYCWGKTIAEAKRHIEVLEFIFECIIKLKLYGGSQYSR